MFLSYEIMSFVTNSWTNIGEIVHIQTSDFEVTKQLWSDTVAESINIMAAIVAADYNLKPSILQHKTHI